MNVLENPDILRLVFECLEVDLPDSMLARRDIFQVSQVCKVWLDPAMDSLWHHLTSLTPLLRLLPGFCCNRGIYFLDSIEQCDWHRFDDYARRVRILSLAFRPPHPDFINLMVLRNRPEPLLRGLKELRVLGLPGTSDAMLALSPNIESVSLEGCDGTMRSLLSSMLTSCPRIRTLSWEAQDQIPTNLHDITKFRHLENLALLLPGTYISSSFMVGLGNLEGLKELTINVGASNPSKSAISPPRGPPMISYPVAIHKFTNLRKLCFIGAIEQIQRLLSFMELKCLKYFTITEHRPTVDGTESYWYQCFERLALSSHLEAIEIEQYARRSSADKNHIAGSWIKPLCSLSGLQTFVVQEGYIRISTAELAVIANAFPTLRAQLPCPEEADSFSWESIAMLANHWPQLQTLQITWGGSFNASAIFEECDQKSNFSPSWIKTLDNCFRLRGFRFASSKCRYTCEISISFFPYLRKLEGVGSKATVKTWGDVFDFYKALQSDILYFRKD